MGLWIVPTVPLLGPALAQAAVDYDAVAKLIGAVTAAAIAAGGAVRWLHGLVTKPHAECLARELAASAAHETAIAKRDAHIAALQDELRAAEREALATTSRQLEALMVQSASWAKEREAYLRILAQRGEAGS